MSGDTLSSAVSSAVRPQDAVRVERDHPTSVDDRNELATESGNSVPVSGKEHTVPDKEVEKAVSHINEFIQSVRRELEFAIDENSGRIVVTVKDATTDEVIRVIPRAEVMQIADQLEEGGAAILNVEV